MIETELKGVRLTFRTNPELFCPKWIDRGTLAMLSQVNFDLEELVLDLGCGYGVVGILAAKFLPPSAVHLVDVDPVAVEYSKANARINGVEGVRIYVSDGLEAVEATGFSLILCNPPYQTDFSLPKRLIRKAFNRLKIGGRLVMVTKRRLWYRNKLISVFGGVRVFDIDGYHVFVAIRTTSSYLNGLIRHSAPPRISQKISRKASHTHLEKRNRRQRKS